MKTVSVIIPAFNEQDRIKRMLEAYHAFFNNPMIKARYRMNWIVVPNGCSDHTQEVVQGLKKKINNLHINPIVQAGKGLAIKAGFKRSLASKTDYVGFVDADMATKPEAFYALLEQLEPYDGVLASRYMPGAEVYPPRPLIKRWGSRFIYEPLVRWTLGLRYYDLQCGAKIFKYRVIKAIANQLTIGQWAFDIELLYLCKKAGFNLHEVPTIWHDQAGSKLKIMSSGMRMLRSLFEIRAHHASNMVGATKKSY